MIFAKTIKFMILDHHIIIIAQTNVTNLQKYLI